MATVQTPVPPRPERVDLILNQLDQLPTLPVVATRILQLTSSDRSSAHDVVQLIQSDQSLSAKILQMVAKSDLGAPRDVRTVEKAVVLLGFKAVRHAVLSIQVFEAFSALDGGSHSQFNRGEFWKHSLAVACAAQLIAERWPGYLDPEEAFVCGLLHDMGKVALDACLPKSYDRVVSLAIRRHCCVIDVERELLGVDHTVAGKRLAQRWKLPPAVAECAWLHHHTPDMLPQTVAHPELVQVVNLADIWVHEQRLGFSGSFHDGVSSQEVGGQMGMPPDVLAQSGPLLLERIEQRADMLGLEDLTPGQMFAQSVTHVNLELSRLNGELCQANRLLESRSALLDAIHRLHQNLHPRLALTEICQLAAGGARDLLDLDSVAVYTRHPQGDIYHVALADARGAVCEVLPLAAPDAGAEEARSHTGLMAAPAATAVIRERLAERLGPAPHWVLPIAHDGEPWGGIMFHAPAPAAQALGARSEQWQVFAKAVGVALVEGHGRLRAERLNEGFAEVNRQLKAAQAELLRARALSLIAEMAAGAAHELNNPLAVIAGRSQLLMGDAEDDKTRKDLRIILEQAHRASEIVSDLMEFAKPDRPRPQAFNLPELLRRLVDEWVAKSSLTAGQMTLDISDETIFLHADPKQMERMFEEFFKNAVEAMTPETAHLRINCRHDLTDDRVAVSVTDNGCGMDGEVLEKARAPFFSHRPAGRGRGLGLSRAGRWCEINGGRISLESAPGAGTTVRVEFPARPQPRAAGPASA